jgi:hypothetical protein
VANCKPQSGCLRRQWIICNNLRAEVGRGHWLKGTVRRGQF